MIIKIPGKPLGKGRPRFTRSGHVFTPPETHKYEKLIADIYFKAGGEFYEKGIPLFVQIIACFPIPKSDTKKVKQAKLKDEIPATNKPDIDNIIKIVLDGLNGVAYADDSQVISLRASKTWAKNDDACVYVGISRTPCTKVKTEEANDK